MASTAIVAEPATPRLGSVENGRDCTEERHSYGFETVFSCPTG
jgi:hypothetical protein